MTYKLVCTRGPMKGRMWEVTPQGVKIGRAEGCEIQVGDVSAELYHCIVKLVDGKPLVQNLASDSGVDVNGISVDEAELDPMDKINVGGVMFVVSASSVGRGGAIVRRVVPLVILLALAGAGAYFYRHRPKSVDVAERPKQTSGSVTTNRVVRIVEELIVTTNQIINIVNNIVVTNYVEEVWRGGILVSAKTLQPLVEAKTPIPSAAPENTPAAVDVHEDPEPEGVPLPEMPAKQEMREYTAKDLEYAPGLPYKVIDPRLALVMGGAFGGDEVRAIKYSNASYDFVHIFNEAAKPKTLVFPKRNRIQPGSGRFLIVAGGGAAFPVNMTGGGGAGGVVEKKVMISDGTAYAYVGAGGLTCGMGCNGEDSILTIAGKTYIAIGGGSGDGYSGGSGGGAGGGGWSVALEGRGLQPESPTGGIGLDGTSWRTHGFKKRGGVCGGSPQYVSNISGDQVTYAKGGLYYETVGRGMAGDENTGSGADGRNGGRLGGLSGGSGIIIVRYNVRIPAGKTKTEVVAPTLPARDKGVRSEWIDGVEWHYFKERNYAVIGCHGMGGSDFPDYWIPAVDTNILVGIVRIPSRIGGLPVKKIGKGAFQGCAKVTKFVVPDGVSACEARAFARCPLLESVVYPKTLEVLGEGQIYRSPLVNTLVFKSMPPKCTTGRCPLKGARDPINAKAHELNLTIPFEFSEQWRHWSQRESQRLIVCKDRCHRNPCYVEFSEKELERGNATCAGFVGEEMPWVSAGDVRDLKDWFVEKAEGLWRKYDASPRGRVLSIPCLYSIGMGNGRGIHEHTAVIHVTFMYFNAREPVYFMAHIDDYAMIMVDGEVVVGFSEKPGEKNECKEPVMFASGGWHRVVIVAANDRDVGGAKGAEGGVYYSRSDNKHWHLFEANPNGKEFRVSPADARRAVADIERARRKKK